MKKQINLILYKKRAFREINPKGSEFFKLMAERERFELSHGEAA